MISNRCARKSLVINCNLITSENYLRFLVDSNDVEYKNIFDHLLIKIISHSLILLSQT